MDDDAQRTIDRSLGEEVKHPTDTFPLHEDATTNGEMMLPPLDPTNGMLSEIVTMEATPGVPPSQQANGMVLLSEGPENANAVGDGATTTASVAVAAAEEEIWEPAPLDVLTGRGASINVHPGNQKFRALCYARKAQFDAANHAAKKRIATDIWTTCVQRYRSRFLARRQEKGPWYAQSAHQAILKAAQTIRDYQRPDRGLRDCTKRRRVATPMDEVEVLPPPEEPIVENPEGVEDHDVLCGRGAFVNGHKGNQYLRQLALARKAQFDAASYSEKRLLASEIVNTIQSLDPPGRFLRRPTKGTANDQGQPGRHATEVASLSAAWVELDMEKSIHKACQVMRDIDREDRKYRLQRKLDKMHRMQNMYTHLMDGKLEGHDEDEDERNIQAPADVESVLDAIAVQMERDGAASKPMEEENVALNEHVV